MKGNINIAFKQNIKLFAVEHFDASEKFINDIEKANNYTELREVFNVWSSCIVEKIDPDGIRIANELEEKVIELKEEIEHLKGVADGLEEEAADQKMDTMVEDMKLELFHEHQDKYSLEEFTQLIVR